MKTITRVRNKVTGQIGFVKVYTWHQGSELAVFVEDDMEFWKIEEVELLHDNPVKKKKVKKVYRDPFEHYAENELDALWESTSGYSIAKEILKDLLQIERLKRIKDYILEVYRTICSKS